MDHRTSLSEQEASQRRGATTPLGWAVVMLARAPVTLDCEKYSNSRLAASRWRVSVLSATAFVNWASCSLMADSSMHSRSDSLSFEPYVLGAVHHQQKLNASSFLPWHFEHGDLPRMSGTRTGVRGGFLLSVSRGPGGIVWPLRLVEWSVPVGVDCKACRTWPMGERVGDWCGPAGWA